MNITSSSWHDFIQEAKLNYQKQNIDPFSYPNFVVKSEDEVLQKQEEYADIISIASFFIKKFLEYKDHSPVIFVLTDPNGCFLYLEGNESMLYRARAIGIQEGNQVEEVLSSVHLALQFQCPVELIGTQHYHQILQSSACYSAPFYIKSHQLLGTISIMTTVDDANTYLLSMLEMVIDSIERELALRMANAKLQQTNEQLYQLAMTDGLTGIPNRRCFDEYITNVCEKYNVSMPLSLILFDIDHFKLYNDTYGHHVGDECLKTIGKMLIDLYREQNVLAARYGGEEFAVILPNADSKKAIHEAEKLQLELKQLQISEINKTVTISAGVATTSVINSRDLVILADKALYLAKQKGRNRIHFISGSDY